MANARGKNKGKHARRAHKVSRGEHGGGGKVTLSPVQKVLINGARGFRPIGSVSHPA